MNHSHSHHEGHAHGLQRSDELAEVSDARLLWAIGLNQVLTVAQVIAGAFSGSVALLSDAAHNFNDANALLIAYVARRISRKRANSHYTFGFRRAEMIGALINLTLLTLIGLYLIYEGIRRFIEPHEIRGGVMAITAVVALIIDLATALLLWAMSKGSLNVRAAFVHNLVDAFGSIAVLIGAAAVIWLDWNWVDPLITLVISGYVLWQVKRLMPQVMRVLMQGTPPEIDLRELADRIESVSGVVGTHHFHVWQLDPDHRSLEAHVVVSPTTLDALGDLKQQIKQLLADEYQISHSTLEFEYGQEAAPCVGMALITPH